MSSDSFITIQQGMKGHQILSVRPENVSFANLQVASIDVQARYQDAKNGFDSSAAFKLTAPTEVQTFEYDYLNPAIGPQYRYDVQFKNGQTRSFDWAPAGDDTVVIGLSNLD
jgi:hypothetical protein